MINYYNELPKTTQKMLKQIKMSQYCFNKIISDAIIEWQNDNTPDVKLSTAPDGIEIAESERTMGFKYNFIGFVNKKYMDESDDYEKAVSTAWCDLKKMVFAPHEKKNEIAEEFGSAITQTDLINELKNLNLCGWTVYDKRSGRLKLILSAMGNRIFKEKVIYVENKQYYTIDEKNKIVNDMKQLAQSTLNDYLEKYNELKKYYGL